MMKIRIIKSRKPIKAELFLAIAVKRYHDKPDIGETNNSYIFENLFKNDLSP